MLPPRLPKFTQLHKSCGLGAVKNLWLLVSLIPVARTVNLYKLKDWAPGRKGNAALYLRYNRP